MSLRPVHEQAELELQAFAGRRARLSPEQRAGEALTAAEILSLAPCPRCDAGLGSSCLSANPKLNAFCAARGLVFAHDERRHVAGAIALARWRSAAA